MRNSLKFTLVLAALALAFAPLSYAQTDSNVATVNLNAVLNETLTVSAAPATVNFTLLPSGPVTGSSPVNITTQWALASTRTNVSLYAYFTTTTALSNGVGNNIPNTSVSGNPNGAGMTPFTGSDPFNAVKTGLQIFSVGITAANVNATHSDALALQIDTTGLGLPAGTYTGILNIEAQAI